MEQYISVWPFQKVLLSSSCLLISCLKTQKMLVHILKITTVLMFFVANVKAQDTIKLQNGITLYGLITEVNGGEIKFRVDGGSVLLNQVISYKRGGQSIIVKDVPPVKDVKVNDDRQQDCELKNTGDISIKNQSNIAIIVDIYLLNTIPENSYSTAYNSNPLISVNRNSDSKGDTSNHIISTITLPAQSSAPVLDIPKGTHFVKYRLSDDGYYNNSGNTQIRVEKCKSVSLSINASHLIQQKPVTNSW